METQETDHPIHPQKTSTGFKVTDWVKPGDKSGEFKRQSSSFRNWISADAGAQFPVEKGRYHLYISYACPWATRAIIARKLKGLEEFISVSSVHVGLISCGLAVLWPPSRWAVLEKTGQTSLLHNTH